MAISDSLILFNVKDGDADTQASAVSLFYYIVRDRQRCYKFYSSSNTYIYTPTMIELTAYQTMGGRRDVFNGSIEVKYYNTLGTVVKTDNSQKQTLNLDFSSITDNIAYVTIDLILNSEVVYSQVMDIDYGTSENMAKFAVNATNITGTINDTSVIFSQQGIKINNGDFTIVNNGAEILSIDRTNHMMSFKGAIDSQSGIIGGWHICSNGIYSDNMQTGLFADDGLKYNLKNIRFWSGRSGSNSGDYTYNFYVTDEGQMYATNAEIQGTIHAINGDITGALIVGTTADGIVLSGTANSFISSSNFASGPNGVGWRLQQDGSAYFTNINASGTITSAVFEYNTISSVGGNLYVSPTFTISADSVLLNGPEDDDTKSISKFNFENNNNNNIECGKRVMISGNFMQGEDIISYSCEGIIQSVTYNSITVLHDKIDGYWLKGSNIIDNSIGLLLTATDEHGPFMAVYNKKNSTIPLVQLGNLEGLTNVQYFGKMSGYGLYASNAYLTGQLILPNAGITNQTTSVIATSGESFSPIRIWAGSSSNDIKTSNFIVTEDGTMIARQGIFNGRVEATNSIFSGVIRAAGIVIDDISTEEKEADYDHFFVAYTDNPGTDYNNYILNIGSDGLSIWQGGFRIYSDSATDTIYGYSTDQPSPLPYVYLVDELNDHKLQARMVAYKQHFLQINLQVNTFAGRSVVIDNGIWFGDVTNISNYNLVEEQSYYNALSKNNGIQYNNNKLSLISEKINLTSKQNIDINNNTNITGQLKIIKGSQDNEIILGSCTIKERYQNSISIGLDFIVE